MSNKPLDTDFVVVVKHPSVGMSETPPTVLPPVVLRLRERIRTAALDEDVRPFQESLQRLTGEWYERPPQITVPAPPPYHRYQRPVGTHSVRIARTAAAGARVYPQTWKAWMLIEQYPGMSLRELAERLGVRSWSTAFAHVQRLRSWGVIVNPEQGGRARTLYCTVPYAAQSYWEDEDPHVEHQ